MSRALRIIRISAWLAIGVIALLAVAVSLGYVRTSWLTNRGTIAAATIGGPFTLVDHKGEPISEKTFLGKPTAYFFGFTHCPDICPTTLAEMSLRLAALGPEGDRFNVVFVTVDPTRDTPAVLAQYLSAFDPRIVGATGTEDEVAAMLRAFRAYAKKAPPDETGSYSVDHTATIYLMDRNGTFVTTIGFGEDEDSARAKMRRLLAL